MVCYGVRPGTTVKATVRLRQVGTGMRLEMEDNGPGLPADFDPDRDAGLGLKIVASLARQNDGEVRFETLNPGTRVTIDWPA